MDLNGHITYSNILEVSIPQAKTIELTDLFPIPFYEKLNINVLVNKNLSVKISICDQLGRLISSQRNVLLPGQNCLEMNLSRFPPGIYYLSLTNDEIIPIIKKIVKDW